MNIDLYIITDRNLSKKSEVEFVREAISGGAKIIQYREKELSLRDMLKTAAKLREITKEAGVTFIINDRIDVALAVNADGVHLGKEDMPLEIARRLLGSDKIIGVTVHNVEEAIEAEKSGADYVGLSPIFETLTKGDAGEAVGTEMIKKVKEKVKIPIVAIGGINESNVQSVIEDGADGVAMISAIVTKEDVTATVKALKKKIAEAR
jgi:thiamine-phosphate pyrophosphorylase